MSDATIINQNDPIDAMTPMKSGKILPQYDLVKYQFAEKSDVPNITFSDIYQHMVMRKTYKDSQINNVKGMDRAVRHYDAGDVGNIYIYIYIYIFQR